MKLTIEVTDEGVHNLFQRGKKGSQEDVLALIGAMEKMKIELIAGIKDVGRVEVTNKDKEDE